MSRFGVDAGIASTPAHRLTVRLDHGLLQLVDQGTVPRSLANPLTPAEQGRLRDARPAGPPPAPAPEPLRVQRRVSCQGALVVPKQRIHVGIVHAGRTLTVQAADTTWRVYDNDGLLAEVARTTTKPITRFKDSVGHSRNRRDLRKSGSGGLWAATLSDRFRRCSSISMTPRSPRRTCRRVKNDVRDAADLADLLRTNRLPEAYVAPPAVRELRELVRHRAKLVALRSGHKAGVHAVLAKQGVHIPVTDLFGVGGRQLLAAAGLDGAFQARVHAQLRLIDAFTFETDAVSRQLRARLCQHPGYVAIQAVPGVGPVLAAVFVAEVGEVGRFVDATRLVSWAGLTPKHRESDTVVHRGPITKQGSGLVRWAAIEAAQKIPASAGWLVCNRARIAERRGRNIATVAVARKLLTLVYYGLRDGHIRALTTAKAAA